MINLKGITGSSVVRGGFASIQRQGLPHIYFSVFARLEQSRSLWRPILCLSPFRSLAVGYTTERRDVSSDEIRSIPPPPLDRGLLSTAATTHNLGIFPVNSLFGSTCTKVARKRSPDPALIGALVSCCACLSSDRRTGGSSVFIFLSELN